jgi:hypothetical protein
MQKVATLKFARRVFLIAGIWGLIVLLPQYFLERKTSRDFPPAITHLEFYYGFLGVAVAWQILFLFLSTNPRRYRPLMIPAILEKASFVIAVLVLFSLNRVSPFLLCVGVPDLIFGLLFLVAYMKTPLE